MIDQGKISLSFKDTLGSLNLDIAFDAPVKGVTALFGPSGCGKTTILRCIAGLHRASSGNCMIGEDVWQSETYFKPVHERPIGYVFQEASLFPHLSVKSNLLFGSKDTKKDQSLQFSEIIELLGIDGHLNRSPKNLSGGERQRVAIGRALLSEPRLLLMDEPLSALDRLTKEEIMPYLERLQTALSIPIFYVSHDINEVERLADHLVLIEKGQLIASGPLAQLQSYPSLVLTISANAAVSLNASVIGYDEKFTIARLQVNGASLNVPSSDVIVGAKQRLKIYADDVSLTWDSSNKSTIDNQIPAKILDIRGTEPSQILAVLGLGQNGEGDKILARVTKRSWVTLGLEVGQSVFAQVKAVALVRRGV
jgi:molybdate transport system ATP-binding protein